MKERRNTGEETAVTGIYRASRHGYGFVVPEEEGAFPDLFIPPNLSMARIPLAGTEPVSFGVYYKPRALQNAPALKSLVHMLRNENWPRQQLQKEKLQNALPPSGEG